MRRPTPQELLGDATPAEPPVRQATRMLPSIRGRTGGESALVGGAFDGASRYNREIALWQPGRGSADSDLLPEKPTIDARSRDILRNDAFVQGASAIHKDNIVGDAYLLNARPAYDVLGLDEDWAAEFQAEVETKFSLWAESPKCWPDAARRNTLTGLVRLAVGVFLAGGEVLASAEWMRSGARPFRTAVQMIDSDRLSTPFYESTNYRVRAGVHMDRYGAALGYYIQGAHPSDYMNPDMMTWKYVKAEKPWGRVQMFHIIEQQRVDQTRGVSELVSALKELRTTKRFREVVLQNAVLNATFAAAIESELPPNEVFASLGMATDESDPVNEYIAQYLGSIAEYANSGNNMQIDGVRIPHLYPGTKLHMQPAGEGGPLGSEFEQSLLRYISASLGVSYEQLSKDYSNTNYSSARAAMNETWKFMRSRKAAVADRFASHVYRLWLEEAMNTGQIETLNRRQAMFYTNGVQNLMWEALCGCDWIGASRGQIDELKETQASVLRMKYGLSTQEDEAARLGKDWRKLNAQRQREKEDQEARGLVIDPADNSLNAASGSPQQRGSDGEVSDGTENTANE